MRAAPWSSMVDSRRPCANGSGMRVRCDARRMSLATTASRSAPRVRVTPPLLHSFTMCINPMAHVGAHSSATGLLRRYWQNREMTATRRASETRRRGPLQPVELAHASVMAALCAATAIVAVVVPFAAGISYLGTVPLGLLVYRFRFRVLVAATVGGATIAFLIAGMGGFMTVLNCAYIGLLIGLILRRGRGTLTVLVVGLVAGAVFGAAVVSALAVLVRLRHLIFDSMTANVDGVAAFMTRISDWWWLPNMEVPAERL